MLCLAQFLSLPQPHSDTAAAASSRPWRRPGGPSMGTSYSTHLRGLSCPVQRTDSVTSSVDTPSCSALSPQLPCAQEEGPPWRTFRQFLQTESSVQVLPASAPSWTGDVLFHGHRESPTATCRLWGRREDLAADAAAGVDHQQLLSYELKLSKSRT